MLFFNIKTKLFLVLVAVSIIPIIVVSLTSYKSYTKLVNEQTTLVASTTLQDSVKSIEEILQNIDRISLTILQQTSNANNYTTVLDELKKMHQTNDSYELFLMRNRLKFMFENILLGYSYINGIYLFTPDGKNISYGTDLLANYSPLQDEWYVATLEGKGELHIGEVSAKPFIINAKPSISVSRSLYDPYTNELIGVFMMDLSMEVFRGLNRNPAPSLSNIYLINEFNHVLYDKSGVLIGKALPDPIAALMPLVAGGNYQHNDGHLLTVIQEVPQRNWKIIAVISVDTIYKQYGISQQLFLYVSLSCAVIFLILSFVLSNFISKPIIKLAKAMRRNKGQHFAKLEIDHKQADEIGILYHEYDKMMQAIDTHIRESYQNKILMLDSQMKALEAQINSHFLYNTLESINSIAEIEEVESIVIMTKALGDMFRYSIKTESELVPTQDELQHVNNYMAIQKIRYGDKIDFKLNVEERLYEHRILKLILQPLVENAIYHGLESKRGKGCIAISGYEEESGITFRIKDDGIGMTPAQVEELQTLLDQPPAFMAIGQRSRQSIGIKNVHSRIQLYYGEEYGISFSSKPDEGTEIIIKLPARN